MKFMSLMTMLVSINVFAAVPVHEDRNEAEYNNQYAVVLNGYDPVSYFPEGGEVPVKGQSAIEFKYGGRVYHFANQENMAIFKSNPLKYEPSYGSWCAYGMSQGGKIQINPLVYTLNGNRLHFFINKSAKKSFDKDLLGLEDDADAIWFDFSGEKPRN